MRPVDVQQIGEELAIKWEDGSESFIPLEKLRRACPCAGCKGEMDVMGNLYKSPEQPLNAGGVPAGARLRASGHLRRAAGLGGRACDGDLLVRLPAPRGERSAILASGRRRYWLGGGGGAPCSAR